MLMLRGPEFSGDHINVVLSDCGFGGMNIHITFFKRNHSRNAYPTYRSRLCFNHWYPAQLSRADQDYRRRAPWHARAFSETLVGLCGLYYLVTAAINIVVKIGGE